MQTISPARLLKSFRDLIRGSLALCCALSLLGACAPAPEVRPHASAEYPQRLSDWGLIERRGDRLVLGEGVLPYDVNTPLFADYAQKLRTVWLPPGRSARFDADQAYDLPEGTLISKTFFYPTDGGIAQATESWDGRVESLDLARARLVETRLLVRQAEGWEALAYVWRGDEAWLSITGAIIPLPLAPPDGGAARAINYTVPSRNQCASCHVTGQEEDALMPIGLTTRQLNRGYGGGPGNQIADFQALGWLDGVPPATAWARNADWADADESLTRRCLGDTKGRSPGAIVDSCDSLAPRSKELAHLARSYLDANCGHCHNPLGRADTTGLWLNIHHGPLRRLGLCKPPIAAGQGTGGRRYSIVPGQPDASILVFRMADDDPATRMPEIGRSIVHQRGLAVVSDWIAALPNECAEPDYAGALAEG